MPFKINDKLKCLTPYEPICDNFKIRLDANESFLDYSDELIKDIFEEIKKIDYKRYPDPNAVKLCNAFKQAYNLNDSDFCVAGNGSDELIGLIISSFSQKGDKVCVLDNDFSMYKFYSLLSENDVIVAKKNANLHIDVDDLIKTVNENNCRILIFSNPCNPTSIGLNKEDVIKIITNVNALVVVDEAYMDFWNQSILNICHEYNNCIILKTCSKALSLASIRLGFAIGSETLINFIKATKSPYNVNSISQAIGYVVLKQYDDIKQNILKILDSKNILLEEFRKIFKNKDDVVYESNTNFIFIKTSIAEDIFENLKKQNIIIRCFGNYLRVTTGTKDENITVINAIKEILNNKF